MDKEGRFWCYFGARVQRGHGTGTTKGRVGGYHPMQGGEPKILILFGRKDAVNRGLDNRDGLDLL